MGVSKLTFQCGRRDAKFCVSTIRLDKLLILNILCAITGIEARHAASLHLMKPHCGAPSMGMGEGRRIYLLFCVIRVGGDGQ